MISLDDAVKACEPLLEFSDECGEEVARYNREADQFDSKIVHILRISIVVRVDIIHGSKRFLNSLRELFELGLSFTLNIPEMERQK